MTSFWENKQVLVTGAGGFIGSHLVEHLVAAGANVRAFIRYNSRAHTGLLRKLPSLFFKSAWPAAVWSTMWATWSRVCHLLWK